MRRLLLIFALLAPLQLLGQTNHYISTSGADSNAGTSTGSPWAHLPGMPGCTSSCASYAIHAGDRFILRGGDTWTHTNFPDTWPTSGTSGSPIYIGVDKTWFTGGSWVRPIFDGGTSNLGTTTNAMLDLRGVDNITVDNIDFNNFHASGYTGAYGSCGIVNAQGLQNVIVENSYFHNMIVDDTNSNECFAVQGATYAPFGGNSQINNNVFEGNGTSYIGIEIGIGTAKNNVAHDLTQMFFPMGHGEISGNLLYNCGYPSFQPGATNEHADAIQINGADGIFYIHDNVIHDTGSDSNGNECEASFYGNPGETDYVWNNVLYNIHGNAFALTQNSSPGIAAYFWNNTVVGGQNGAGYCIRSGHAGTYSTIQIINNHCMSTQSQAYDPALSATTFTANHNLLQTIATADANSSPHFDQYTSSQTYGYSPVAFTNSTVGVGANLTSNCSGSNAGLCSDTGYGSHVTSGNVSSYPTKTINARPSSAAWDIGAYAFTSGSTVATPVLSPTSGSYAPPQTVTISDSTPASTIYYTTDGSTPTTSSTVYTGPLTISVTTTVKAMAAATGLVNSAVATALYTITPNFTLTVNAINGTVSGSHCATGSYASGTIVGACSATPSAGFTFAGWSSTGSASCSGTGTCGPFTISANSSITASFASSSFTLSTAITGTGSGSITGCAGAHAFGAAYTCTVAPAAGSTLLSVSGCGGSGTTTYTGTMPSANCTVTATFQGTVATPTFSPTTLSQPGRVTVKSTTPGSTCYYTVDGTAPTTSSAIADHLLYVAAPQTLTALCAASGYTNSASASQAYSPAIPAVRFSLLPHDLTNVPNPYPLDNRPPAGAGTGLADLCPSRGSCSWTTLGNWITQTQAHSGRLFWTIQKEPTWMTGLGSAQNAPSDDLATSGTCQTPIATTVDFACKVQEVAASLGSYLTGLSSQPSTPQSCSAKLYEIDGDNEFNGAASGSWVGWGGTASQLATQDYYFFKQLRKWCSDIILTPGSVSSITGGGGSIDGHFDTAYEQVLAAWPQGQKPDAAAQHHYPARQTVFNSPFPTTVVSNNSSLCTLANTPNSNCYVSVGEEANTLQSVFSNSGHVAWSKYFSIFGDEEGFGEMRQMCGSTSCSNTDPETIALRSRYVSQYMLLLAVQPTLTVQFYLSYDPTNSCGSTDWGCYEKISSTTNSGWYPAFVNTKAAVGSTCPLTPGAFTSTPVTGGNIWTKTESCGQYAFFDGWYPATTNYTTSYTTATDLTSGTTAATGGVVALSQAPVLLQSGLTYALTTAIAGTGSGTITGCAGTYSAGDPYVCSVLPATGSTLTSVTGCGGSGTTSYSGSMPASACTVTATFTLNTYTLTVGTAGVGSGTVSGCANGTYNYGTAFTCAASPAAGSSFIGWTGTGSASSCSTGSCSFAISANSSVTANFGSTTYTLSTATAGTGSGTITGCGGSYAPGAAYSCTVTAGAGSSIASVTGCSGSGTTTYAGTMPGADCTVTATFSINTYTFSVSTAGAGSGTLSGTNCTNGTYNSGTAINCIPTPSVGSSFFGWSGTGSASICTSTGNCTFTLGANSTATATFGKSSMRIIGKGRYKGKLRLIQ